MLIQVTAYEVLDALVVQATTATTTETGRNWENRILEQLSVPAGCEGDAWDLIWLVGQELCEQALRRGARERAGRDQTA